MTFIVNKLHRFAPLLAAAAIAALAQLFSHASPWLLDIPITARLANHAPVIEWVLGIASALSLSLVVLGALRASGRIPDYLAHWTWLMDILDRLTDRADLEAPPAPRPVRTVRPAIHAPRLAAALKSRLIGQDIVCDQLAAHLRDRMSSQPAGNETTVVLFAGPSGTGKTYLGQLLAKELNRPLIHLDLSHYGGGESAASSLFASRADSGSDQPAPSMAALRDAPDALVLLDDFEQAHPDIRRMLMIAWRDGFLTLPDGAGRISTAAAIFVLTTSAAVDAWPAPLREGAESGDSAAESGTSAAGLTPERPGPIGRVFAFNALADLDVARIAALETERMIEAYGLTIAETDIDPDVFMRFIERQKRLGKAASLRQLVPAIKNKIAASLVEASRRGDKRVKLIYEFGRVRAFAAG